MAAPSAPHVDPTGGASDAPAGNGRFVPPPPPPGARQAPPVTQPLATASKAAGRQLLRPRVRVALVGVIAVLVAWWWVEGSAGTLLTIIGIVMLLAAWFGPRMQGRFVLEWGENGTTVEFNAGLQPAAEPFKAPVREALNAPRTSAPEPKSLAAVPGPPTSDVIEGEAHTVEIDVDELKALIAAVEQAEATHRGAA